MSKVIILDKDSRFRSPFYKKPDAFKEWLLGQLEVRHLYRWLDRDGYTFTTEYPGNEYMVDVYKEVLKHPLRKEPVFVFGSNLEGIHGAGSAKFAKEFRDAVMGTGVGRTGNAYALPTKDTPYDTLSLEKIDEYITQFVYYTRDHTKDHFYVSRVGCKLAGYKDAQIAKLFRQALPEPVENIHLPYFWTPYKDDRLIIAGSRGFKGEMYEKYIEKVIAKFPKTVHLILGGAWGIDTTAEKVAIAKGIPYTRYPAWWERYGKAAGFIRNEEMLHDCSAVGAVWDGESRGTKSMIELANAANVDLYLITVKPGEE